MSESRPESRKPTVGRRKTRGRWRKLLLYVIVISIVAAMVVGLWPKPVKVDTATVLRGPLVVSVLEEGKTRIRNRYVIYAPVMGFLNRVELKAGAPIKAGETVLATMQPEASGFLDPRTQAEVEARLKAAEAAKAARQADVERIKAELDLAVKEFGRTKALRQSGAIAKQQWDVAQNHVETATHALHSAESALQVAISDIAQVKAALAQAQLPESPPSEPLKILAPVDGFVLNVIEENARTATPALPIMEVGDPRDLEAEVDLFSKDAVHVEPGAEVSIEQWGGEKPLRARVSVIERGGFTKLSALGVEEQRVKVHVQFIDMPPESYTLGDRFRVEARIVTWQADDVLQAPTGALFRLGNDWMAFVVQEGKAVRRKVEINHNNGISAEVVSGLAVGEVVIVYPPEALKEGASVAAQSDAVLPVNRDSAREKVQRLMNQHPGECLLDEETYRFACASGGTEALTWAGVNATTAGISSALEED